MGKNSRAGLAVGLLFAGSMWFYVEHILIPHQRAEATLHGTPRGNLSDLYPRWLGARELLLHHRDPYSPEITREIQVGYYGRELDAARTSDPKDQQGFAYPAFVVFLLAPTIGIPFPIVQTGFRWFLVALTAATVLLWLRTLRWRPPFTMMALLIALTLGSFQVLQGIKLQQLSLVVGGLIAGCALLLAEGYLAFAGILLALATIKPQLFLPLLGWLLLWAFSDWRRRQNLIWGFIVTIGVLFASAEYVLPGWVGRFRGAITAYRKYNDGAGSVLDVLLTPEWGRLLAALIVVTFAVTAWKFRRASNDSNVFNLMLGLVLAITVVIVPKAAPYNQILLLPGILLLATHWQLVWHKNPMSRILLMVCGLLIFWPWLAATALTLVSLGLPADTIQKAWAFPVWTSFAIPLAVAVLLAVGLREFIRAEN